MVTRLALIGAAGALGTIARYGVQLGVIARAAHPATATLLVNTAGCFLLGLAWSLFHQGELMHADLRLVVFTGFLGAFTTFSALVFDTAKLARDYSPVLAFANISGQVVAGLLLMALGMLVGRAL
ncbi:MAG: CrcB protein [Thermoleophilia bacterium]|nr:CrcB protein [Thermoleophilia bacterium]